MGTPQTYAEWVSLLDKMAAGTDDEAVLRAMQAGTIEWQRGVADRFTKRLMKAVQTRMDKAMDQFDRTMQHGSGEGAIIRALLDLRASFAFLAQAVNLPAIPEEYRQKYVSMIREQADKVQQSLEDSAKSDHTGKLSGLVKRNPMNQF